LCYLSNQNQKVLETFDRHDVSHNEEQSEVWWFSPKLF
jgi:hypothetical protein